MLSVISVIALLGWLYLAALHGRFWQLLLPSLSPPPGQWPSVDIIVPARNEADTLPATLPALLGQNYPGEWRIIWVDDHSDDGTGDKARSLGGDRLHVIDAPELPAGWSGKLAALNAGAMQSTAEYILFTDADIKHPGDSLRELVANALAHRLDLSSLMVKLHCQTMAEKLLIPAFVFFFAMLYPFRYANDPQSSVAAAAGGVILIKRTMLDKIGGLAKIKAELIDDCALAKAVKKERGRTEITLTQDVESLRVYPKIDDVRKMIARTAFTQLQHSTGLLAGTVIGMTILFLMPVFLLLIGNSFATFLGLAAWLIMSMIYLPMILFYRLPFYWAFTLPVAGAIYTIATIDSARLYWQGRGGEWKGRTGVRGSGVRENRIWKWNTRP